MAIHVYCPDYWIIRDSLDHLLDLREDGFVVSEEELTNVRAKLERHKRECSECKRPDSQVDISNRMDG
jgi:hypothetical protein